LEGNSGGGTPKKKKKVPIKKLWGANEKEGGKDLGSLIKRERKTPKRAKERETWEKRVRRRR